MASVSGGLRRAGRIAAVVAIAAGALVLAAPAQATFPGTDGLIAFLRGGEIWTVNAGGFSETQVTFTGGTVSGACGFSGPNFSPNGTQITFDYGGGLGIIPATGGSTVTVTGSAAGDCNPRWNPAGTQLVFEDGGGFGSTGLFTINAGGGGRTAIFGSLAGDIYPDWAPDNARIAFFRSGGNAELFRIAPGGGTAVQLTTNCGPAGCTTPTHSPDSSTIIAACFNAGCGGPGPVFVTVPATAASAAASALPTSVAGDDAPYFSPQGNRVAGDNFIGGGIFIINASGLPGRQTVTITGGDIAPSWGVGGGAVIGDQAPAFTACPATWAVPALGGAQTVAVAASDANASDTVTLAAAGPATLASTPGNPANGTLSYDPNIVDWLLDFFTPVENVVVTASDGSPPVGVCTIDVDVTLI